MQAKARSYRDLVVWRKAIDLAKLTYRFTRSFPNEERFGLTAQMRRAAVSIPSNIAEGQARRTTGEFLQFISHAQGSVAELDTQVVLAAELAFCTQGEADVVLAAIAEIQKMLDSLKRRLQTRASAPATSH